MKAILSILLVAVSASAADAVESEVTSVTNGNRVVCKRVYTRDGITNLVQKVYTRDGAVEVVWQDVYCRGTLALQLCDMIRYGLTCSAHSVPDVKVGTHFTPEGVLDHVNFMTSDLFTLDHFTVTNRLLHPVSDLELRKGNELCADVGELFLSSTNSSPVQFKERAAAVIRKHRAK